LFPRDRYPRLKKTGYLDHDFHSLVCTIHQISIARADFINRPMLIMKSGSRHLLSPLKIQAKEKHLSFQERPEPDDTDWVRCFI